MTDDHVKNGLRATQSVSGSGATSSAPEALQGPHSTPARTIQEIGRTLPYACRDEHRWSGSRTCHCGTCHHSFSGVTHFDRHRRNGRCLDSREVGLTLLAARNFDCWGVPEEAIP